MSVPSSFNDFHSLQDQSEYVLTLDDLFNGKFSSTSIIILLRNFSAAEVTLMDSLRDPVEYIRMYVLASESI